MDDYKKIQKRIIFLKKVIQKKKESLLDFYKKERAIKLATLTNELKLLEIYCEKYDNFTNRKSLSLKKIELERERLDLINYKEYLLNEWEQLDPNHEELRILQEKYQNLDKVNKLDILEKFHTKTNGEWISLIIDLLNENSDKEYHLTNITISKSANNNMTYLVIKPMQLEINYINKDMLEKPFAYFEDYDNSSFILYDSVKNIDYDKYLTKEKTIYRLLGMPKEIEKKIVECSQNEYNKERTREL